jgi:hypothetical protein
MRYRQPIDELAVDMVEPYNTGARDEARPSIFGRVVRSLGASHHGLHESRRVVSRLLANHSGDNRGLSSRTYKRQQCSPYSIYLQSNTCIISTWLPLDSFQHCSLVVIDAGRRWPRRLRVVPLALESGRLPLFSQQSEYNSYPHPRE